ARVLRMKVDSGLAHEVEALVDHPRVEVSVLRAIGHQRQQVIHLEPVDDVRVRAACLELEREVVTDESATADDRNSPTLEALHAEVGVHRGVLRCQLLRGVRKARSVYLLLGSRRRSITRASNPARSTSRASEARLNTWKCSTKNSSRPKPSSRAATSPSGSSM